MKHSRIRLKNFDFPDTHLRGDMSDIVGFFNRTRLDDTHTLNSRSEQVRVQDPGVKPVWHIPHRFPYLTVRTLERGCWTRG
jgi:hypothetical protein